MKKALVIIPSGTTGDSQCCDMLRAVLESLGYEVAIESDLFEAQSDTHNLLALIQKADLIVCELSGREALVFYCLGAAHALGKRVLMLSEKQSDIPFGEIPGESLVYNSIDEHWDEAFSSDLARAVRELEASPAISSGQRVPQNKKRPFIRWALSNEIKFNLSALESVRAKDLVFLGVWHRVDRESVRIVFCETYAFESEDVQRALEGQGINSLSTLKAVYEGFYKINQKAGAADKEVSVKTAQEYLQAIREFENSLVDAARDLMEELTAKGL